MSYSKTFRPALLSMAMAGSIAATPAMAADYVIDTERAHAERDKHLRSADFLDVNQYPEAQFVSTSYTPNGDGTATLDGELTLHGVTRPISIAVEKIGEGQDPWGGHRVGFSGETELQLKDFGIDYNLGPASETVYLGLEVEGIRQ